MCGGFTCSKNALIALNILYVVSVEAKQQNIFVVNDGSHCAAVDYVALSTETELCCAALRQTPQTTRRGKSLQNNT